MFCKNCGNQLPDNALFCGVCGTKVNEKKQQTASVSQGKRKGKVPFLKIGIPLVILLIIALLAVPLYKMFSAETVYLMTDQRINYGAVDQTITISQEYDEDGNILKYKRVIAYDEEMHESGIEDQITKTEYEYDKKGKLIAAELETNDTSYELEYIYDGSVLEEVVSKEDSDGIHLEASCDSDGLIEEIIFSDEDGNVSMKYLYEYHDNGNLKERQVLYGGGGDTTVINKFNESGLQIEYAHYYEEELVSRTVYDYDGHDNVVEESTYDSDNQLESSLFVEYEYDKNNGLKEISFRMEEDDKSGNVECRVEGDELEKTIEFVDFSGDAEEIGYFSEDHLIELEYDEDGNLTKYSIYEGDELIQETSTEYEKFKVSKDFIKPASMYPLWFMF